jgi:hypothetical protein
MFFEQAGRDILDPVQRNIRLKKHLCSPSSPSFDLIADDDAAATPKGRGEGHERYHNRFALMIP